MYLQDLVKLLDLRYPRCLACKWDNVGLLVNPPNVIVKKVMLTNDLTTKVFDEAKSSNCNMIICYHPVIFNSIKSLNCEGLWKNNLCLEAYTSKIAIYCPHTILDVIENGVNDWLANAFKDLNIVYKSTIIPLSNFSNLFTTVCQIPKEKLGNVANHVLKNDYVDYFCIEHENNLDVKIYHNRTLDIEGFDTSSPEICKSVLKNMTSRIIGEGRIIQLKDSVSLNDCINTLKNYLGLKTLKIALGKNSNFHENSIKSIALCAGSGRSVLKDVKADLVLTGELMHHDVLDFCESGTNVVLTHHSNSERGFLLTFMKQIKSHLVNCGIIETDMPKFFVSERDCDPIFFA